MNVKLLSAKWSETWSFKIKFYEEPTFFVIINHCTIFKCIQRISICREKKKLEFLRFKKKTKYFFLLIIINCIFYKLDTIHIKIKYLVEYFHSLEISLTCRWLWHLYNLKAKHCFTFLIFLFIKKSIYRQHLQNIYN